jgi:8-oxo-dGTP pyrophosphatase MutT (NUDIX family)
MSFEVKILSIPTNNQTVLFKVTAFVTRIVQQQTELLLFRHPNAGIQFPAGTVEEGELPERAVLREVAEETGITGARLEAFLCYRDAQPPGVRFILQKPRVYVHPDFSSEDTASFILNRGTIVSLLHSEAEFALVTYEEWDRYPDPQHLTLQVSGWVPIRFLSDRSRRFFYHLVVEDNDPSIKDLPGITTDNHIFYPFWARLDALPEIIESQREWLSIFLEYEK